MFLISEWSNIFGIWGLVLLFGVFEGHNECFAGLPKSPVGPRPSKARPEHGPARPGMNWAGPGPE